VVAPVSEADERLPAGPRGAKGERGERGLSRLQGRAVVVLFLIAALSSGSGWFWQAHETRAAVAAEQREQAAQRQQGAAIEDKLCKSLAPLASLATLQPPAGNPSDNPSRAYEQELSARLAPLAQLGPDIGCGKTAR
jgi:type II secretory pathway pseudopilin PulG